MAAGNPNKLKDHRLDSSVYFQTSISSTVVLCVLIILRCRGISILWYTTAYNSVYKSGASRAAHNKARFIR